MKIADYGKAITSYIESPTTGQKLKSKESANLLAEVDFSGMSLPALKIYYERETGLPAPKDSRQLIIELKRLMKGLDEDGIPFSTGGRVHLAEGSEDIVEPSKSMQVDTTTKGLDLFTINNFKDKAEIYVGALYNGALPTADIKSALNKFTQKGIDDGTFTADDAIKIVQDLKFQFQDRAQKQRLRDNIIEGTGTVDRKDFSNGSSLMDEYLGAQKEYQKAVDDGFQGTFEEFLRYKSSGSFADGGRAKFQDGLSVQTLDPLFPTQDPTSTDFKPLDIPGAIIPPLAIGAGAKRLKDIFFPDAEEMEKEKEKLKEMTKPIGFPAEPSIEIGTTTGEKPEVKIDTKEVFPAGENIKPVAEGFPADTEQLPIIFESKKYSEKALKGIDSETLTDLNKIIKDYRDLKTRPAGPVISVEKDGRVRVRERPASTQPIMSEADKVELLNLVIDKYKEKENKLPDATQLTALLPSLNVSSLAKRNDIELGKRPTGTYDRNDPVYIATQRENKQLKANENNTITNFADENFFPNTIQLKDGSTVNAEKFFIDNLVKRTELGPSRLGTYDTVLKNKELAELFNTNIRKIEEVIKNIRNNPDFQAEYPPPRSKNYANEEAIKILKDAREYAKTLPNGELHVENVLIQERKRIPDLNNLFKNGTLKITDYPRIVEDLNTTMDKKTGIIDKTITKTEKEMTERAMRDKGLFQVFHNVPKSSRQKNIEFLSNRYLSLYKTNAGFVRSAEAYIKNQKDNPDYKERVEDFDNYLKERGLRIKIDNKFYGIDFQEMINSDTGEFTGMNRTLEYYGLPKFENGVPLKKVKKAE